jgi:hypothetical protein
MPFITFDQYKLDMIALGQERLLSQYKDSQGIQNFLAAMTKQTQDLNDIEQTVFLGRCLENAVGVQLDIIGRIVGLNRPVVAGDEILYFQFDSTPAQNWDAQSGWWISTAPDTGNTPVSDAIYRRFIVGKIFKNQVTGGTIPEILVFIKIVFSVDASITPADGEVMAIDITVPSSIDPALVNLLSSIRSDDNVENEYFLPIPAGVRINDVIVLP